MRTKKLLLAVFMTISSVCAVAQWSDQNSSITNDLNDVHFLNNNTGWAVGRQGKIVRTTDGGATWSSQNSGTTNDLNQVFMVSTSVGYAVGDGGKVLKYNGSSWSSLTIGFSQDMYSVYFLDASTGWISGNWGRIMMTTDGGSNWTTQVDNSMYSNSFQDIYMINSTDGWAVGSTGRILHYDGFDWNDVPSGTSEDLNTVSFSSASNGFIGGESSTMLYCDGNSISTYGTDLPDNSFHIYGLCVLNNSLAYAATSAGFGGGGIILKYNGSTWAVNYEYTGMNTELFTGIHFPSTTKGYAVANTGIIKAFGSGGGPSGISDNTENEMMAMVYPNPFNNNFTVSCEVKAGEQTNIALLDVTGKLVCEISSEIAVSDQLVVDFDATTIEAGIYFVQVTSGDKTSMVKVTRN